MFIYPWGDMHSLNLGWFLLQFKDWVEKIQEYLDNGGGTSENLANVIAPVFNAANSYLTGDYVMYNDELYKANEAISPGTWDPSKWTRCLAMEEISSGAGIDNVARLMIAGNYSANYGYQKYAICRYNDKLWMCNTNLPSGGEEWNSSHWDEITVGAGLTGLRRSVETLSGEINLLESAITKAKSITQISDFGADSFYFNAAANITLTPTNIIIPLYSKGVFITTGNDGVLFAITSTGEEITAYRNGRSWTNPKKKTSTRLLGKQIAIYGDSWATDTYGSLGASYLTALTGKTVHVSALGSQTMKQTYDNLWDSFNADIYIIHAGLNDKVQNVGATEFIKAVKDFVSAIRTVNANAEIYFITPQMTHVANQYQNCFPNEFYRIILWRLSGIYSFGCINSLKWQDVKLLSDNTHPTAASIPLIANHIINALENYGDEETHDTEFSNLGRADNQLLFYCEGGIFFFLTQSVNVEGTTANYIELAFNIGTQFMHADTVTTNRTSGSFTRMYYDATTPNYIKFSVASLPVGGTFTNNGTKLIVTIVDLQIPISVW